MSQTMDPNNMPLMSEASVSVEIETEDMTLNIGPQHPSTHGVLRLVAKVNGEKIYNVEPCLLYTSPSPRDLSTSRMPSSA